VVGDITFPSVASSANIDTEMQVYQPLAQNVAAVAGIVVRTARPSDTVAGQLKRVVASLDGDVAVVGLSTARATQAQTNASFDLLGSVLGAFAALGLVLAAVGIFGVVSYSTAQRSGEIGLRVALGARQSAVLWLVLKQGLVVTGVGAAAGLAGGIGLGRVLAANMPRLPSPEIMLVGAAAALMVLVALIAMFIPARRASLISPMIALRHE
jgi:putative ABC transport system permease protein